MWRKSNLHVLMFTCVFNSLCPITPSRLLANNSCPSMALVYMAYSTRIDMGEPGYQLINCHRICWISETYFLQEHLPTTRFCPTYDSIQRFLRIMCNYLRTCSFFHSRSIWPTLDDSIITVTRLYGGWNQDRKSRKGQVRKNTEKRKILKILLDQTPPIHCNMPL